MTRPVVIVAGAGGAGAAAARRLAADGAYAVVLDHKDAHARATAEAASADGSRSEGHGIDLLDLDAVTALRDDLVSRHGRVDAIVHLVGGWRGDPELGAGSVANWQALHPPIVGTLAVLTAAFAEQLRSSEHGRLIMVTSTTASDPTVTNIAYAAAKRAAEAWMEGVASYFASTRASSVTLAIKALVTDAMQEAEPERDWTGFTHVDALAATISRLCLGDAVNGSRIDLTEHTSA